MMIFALAYCLVIHNTQRCVPNSTHIMQRFETAEDCLAYKERYRPGGVVAYFCLQMTVPGWQPVEQ